MAQHICPNKGCKYTTPHAHRMQLHQSNTGHGQESKRKEFRGHLKTKGKK